MRGIKSLWVSVHLVLVLRMLRVLGQVALLKGLVQLPMVNFSRTKPRAPLLLAKCGCEWLSTSAIIKGFVEAEPGQTVFGRDYVVK